MRKNFLLSAGEIVSFWSFCWYS